MTDPGEITEDGFLGGRLLLRQPKSGHRAGHDAMLLAAATRVRPGDRVADFGAGVGAAGLAVAKRAGDIALVMIEIDATLAGLARANAVSNAITADVIAADVTSPAGALAEAGLASDSIDVVLMNPPYNDPSRHRVSPNRSREIAHMAPAGTLDGWLAAARRILKSGGLLTLIWRADDLAELMGALARGFGSLAILPVHGDPTKPAIRLLVRATKGGKAPTRIYPGLMLNDALGRPGEGVREILAGKAILPLAQP